MKNGCWIFFFFFLESISLDLDGMKHVDIFFFFCVWNCDLFFEIWSYFMEQEFRRSSVSLNLIE